MAVSAKSWSRERRSVAAHFAVLGLVCATWGTSIDDMKLLLGLDEAQLGWLLFSGPVGCLVSFIFARALMKRLGSRRNLVLSTNLYIASAIAGAVCFLMRTPILSWCLVTACLAAAGNLFNISANTQAGIIERTEGQTVMGSFHAIFSLMCLVASAVAVLTSHLGIPPEWRLTGIIAISVVAHLAFMRGLPAEAKMPARQAGERMRLPDAQLLAVGLAALVVIACEGAVNNWVGVFYGDALGAPPGQIKWGYCAVGVMTVLGRFSADPLVGRFGPGKVFRPCPDGDRRICCRGVRHLRPRADPVFKGEQDEVDVRRVGVHVCRRHGLPRRVHGVPDCRMRRPHGKPLPCPRHIRRDDPDLPLPPYRRRHHRMIIMSRQYRLAHCLLSPSDLLT